MGKFPVIFITLKGVCDLNYTGAKNMLRYIVGNEAMRFQFLLTSERLSAEEREQYRQLIAADTGMQQKYAMSDTMLTDSLRTLCELLYKHYGEKPILLIDEYDVPLEKAQQYGYYDEMLPLIRNFFAQVLKGNDSLQFAVLTGCLRISKKSIFTDLTT